MNLENAHELPSRPVFVDPSGRRRRRMRIAGIALAAVCGSYGSLVSISVLGVPLGPLRDLPGTRTAPQDRSAAIPHPVERGSDASLGPSIDRAASPSGWQPHKHVPGAVGALTLGPAVPSRTITVVGAQATVGVPGSVAAGPTAGAPGNQPAVPSTGPSVAPASGSAGPGTANPGQSGGSSSPPPDPSAGSSAQPAAQGRGGVLPAPAQTAPAFSSTAPRGKGTPPVSPGNGKPSALPGG